MSSATFSTRKSALLAIASPAALLLGQCWAVPALAQSTPAAPLPAAADEAPSDAPDIVVTGSRIASPDATSVSPISVIGGEELSQRGTVRVEDLINTLPQAYADQGGGNRGGSVGASGTATVNLRNLGNQRTLVLIDGRRLMQGDPDRAAAQAPDINNIPAALVQRVEVVTGGASAVYGSDALAGVVNFIIKRDFNGVQVDGQAGLFSHSNGNSVVSAAALAGQPYATGNKFDGGQQTVSITAGKNFAGGRGNITAYVGYRSISGVGTADRDFSTCNLVASVNNYTCSLSSATNPAQFQLFNPATGISRGTYTLDATTGNSLRTYKSSDGFNNGNTYDLQAPDKKVNADLFGHYEFSPAVDVYGEFMFMHDEADIKLSPTATFSVAETVNCDNPYLSAQERNLICTSVGLGSTANATVGVSQRNVQGGSRHDYTTHDAYRGVLGVKGQIAPGWRYDVYGQYGRTNYNSYLTGDYSLTRFARALQAVTNASGQVVCKSAVSGVDPACVPINIFQIGGISQAALNYVSVPVRRKGYIEEGIVSGAITGDLGFGSPFASHGIGVAIGAEYRNEKLSLTPDSYYSTKDVAGNSGGEFPISGSYNVKEVFGEIRIPLVEDKAFFHSLALDGGVRYSSYSTAGDTVAFKAGADWAPFAALRFRGSYQRAVRAPNLVELFGPQRGVTASLSDPCEGTAPKATAAQCALSGVTAAQYGNIVPAAGQLSGALVGGNPNLDPETSNTKSFGVQLTPPFLRGVTLSVDYFDIDVKKLITTVPATITLTQCINTGVFCSLIQRNPLTGSLVSGGNVITTSVNAGYLKTSGLDIALTAAQDLGDIFGGNPGKLSINFAGTRTSKYEVQILPGSEPYRCDGYFGVTCGQPIPKWRHRALVGWTAPGGAFNLATTWRYIGSTVNDKSSSAAYLKGTYQPYDYKLRAVSYFDFAAAVNVGKKLTLRAGVNNAFDVDPPVTASAGGQTSNGAFFSGVYDALGRYMFVGATARF